MAGSNIGGKPRLFPGVVGAQSFRIFNLEVAAAGVTEDDAVVNGFHPISVITRGNAIANAMPDPKKIGLKLTADRATARLIGAQAVGEAGVVSRINTLSAALWSGLGLEEIGCLDLAYAPPFSGAWDIIHKGGNEFILGAMVTGSALASIVFAIPLGRMADRVGRKRVLYITIPLFWLSNLMLILAPSPSLLVIAGILQGFYFICAPIAAAIEREMVPPEQMGRWIGITRFFKMATSAVLALFAGIIWDKIGPQYSFIFFVGIDLLIRLPLLISIPETLHVHFKSKADG